MANQRENNKNICRLSGVQTFSILYKIFRKKAKADFSYFLMGSLNEQIINALFEALKVSDR